MNPWSVAASVLLAALIPVMLMIWRRGEMDAVVGIELVSVVVVMVLVLLAEAYADPSLSDPAVVLALLSFGGALVYVRFLERWT